MALVAEFTMPSDRLPFGRALKHNPDMRIELERIIPTGDTALPFFWVLGNDPRTFLEAAEEESTIQETEILERVEAGALFRATWAPNTSIIEGIKQLHLTILSSVGTAEQWKFEVRARDRCAFVQFQRLFESEGIPVRLDRLSGSGGRVGRYDYSLTEEQRETILRAYELGYFEVPRGITQDELGAEFDVSHRAISGRLRRGLSNLIDATLIEPSQDT